MTREEAIAELREDKALYESDICYAGDGTPDGRLLQAIDMAIEALHREEAEAKGYCHRIMPSNVEVVVRCKDCIQKHIGGSVTHYYWCDLWDREVDCNNYCSWGERREP